ncbi:MAG: CDP-glucose 4,6-dehydratase [Bacillota bacterium]
MTDFGFWKGKNVFITGHTGFKGAWLSLWLISLGAKVTGYALPSPTEPNLFKLSNLQKLMNSQMGDIRDRDQLNKALKEADPDVIFHMAAQPLVNLSYNKPVETFEINVMGTINLLEGVRTLSQIGRKKRALVNITTDKCYENNEWHWGYREIDRLGGYDPYSNSKACSELVTSSYRNSFFNPVMYEKHGIGVATARAGNVIGGGDWAEYRIIPDCMRAFLQGSTLKVRNPQSVRPWQHVLEPLGGYLILAEKLYLKGTGFGDAWNFGPADEDTVSVEWIINNMIKKWDKNINVVFEKPEFHETAILKLDCSKAYSELGWKPKWNIDKALDKVVEWFIAYRENEDLYKLCLKQIREYNNFNIKIL